MLPSTGDHGNWFGPRLLFSIILAAVIATVAGLLAYGLAPFIG
jgi:hypothetical protein